MTLSSYLATSQQVLAATLEHPRLEERMEEAISRCVGALAADKVMMVCGNGGSAADAMHITGELVGRFLKERKALNCVCLSSNPSVLTAWANDYEFATVFSRQVEAYGTTGGVLLGISTSGNSENVVRAFAAARALGVWTIGMTGEGGGKMAPVSDILLDVPSRATPLIQQVHICLYHYLCQEIEARLAPTMTR